MPSLSREPKEAGRRTRDPRGSNPSLSPQNWPSDGCAKAGSGRSSPAPVQMRGGMPSARLSRNGQLDEASLFRPLFIGHAARRPRHAPSPIRAGSDDT
jgi:hypothetical protein